MSDLEEFEMIETSLGCFKSSSDSFHLSPDIDEGFRLSRSRDLRVFKISQHEVKFRTHEEIHTFLEMPGVLPQMFLSQCIPFGDGFDFCFREVEDIMKFFFKKKIFFQWGFLCRFRSSRESASVLF